MAMNVPTWENKGVSPSDERKQEGYSAGQCLPANHLNWFLNQIFTNLEDAKGQLANLTSQSSSNNTYINSVRTNINKLVANMPIRAVCGTYTGTDGAGQQTINIGIKPLAVIICDRYGNDHAFFYNGGSLSKADGTNYAKIATNGFQVGAGYNTQGNSYHYMAFIEY